MKPLVDLRVRHERLPEHSKLETTYKRALIASSFRFDVNKIGDKISVEGFADAKIPMKKPWRFEASALWSPASRESLVDFDVSTERDPAINRIREWKREGAELKFREFENGAVSKEATHPLHDDLMPLSSPFLLYAALQSSIADLDDSYGALLVVGSKFAAFRLDPVSIGHITLFRGAVIPSRTPLRRADWLALPWHQAKPFDLSWNRETTSLTEIVADVPILGSLKLDF